MPHLVVCYIQLLQYCCVGTTAAAPLRLLGLRKLGYALYLKDCKSRDLQGCLGCFGFFAIRVRVEFETFLRQNIYICMKISLLKLIDVVGHFNISA